MPPHIRRFHGLESSESDAATVDSLGQVSTLGFVFQCPCLRYCVSAESKLTSTAAAYVQASAASSKSSLQQLCCILSKIVPLISLSPFVCCSCSSATANTVSVPLHLSCCSSLKKMRLCAPRWTYQPVSAVPTPQPPPTAHPQPHMMLRCKPAWPSCKRR